MNEQNYLAMAYAEELVTPMGSVLDFANQYEDIINLSVGDPDWTTPKLILDKAFADGYAGHTKYGDYRGYPELRQEIAKFYEEDYHVSLSDKEIMVTAGGCVSMYLALEAILDPGDQVLVFSPYFTPYPEQIKLAGGVPVFVPTLFEENFQIDMARLRRAVTEQTKAIIVNTPCNPSGVCLTEKNLAQLAVFAAEQDLVIIADDIYTAFSYRQPFIPIMSLPKMRERTITINSFSKNFLMTGFRIANVVAPAPIIRAIQQINENLVFTSPSISQRAAIHALRHRKELCPPIAAEYEKRVAYVVSRIQGMKNIEVLPVGGTFYVFPCVKNTGLTSAKVCEKLLKEAHLLVIDGSGFGSSGEGHFRISCTQPLEVLEEAMDRMAAMELFR